MKLRYGQRCRCGAWCEAGTRVVWDHEAREVVACPACALVSHVAEVAPRPDGASLAESMRRDRIRRAKARKP